jgi:hypothetical protein
MMRKHTHGGLMIFDSLNWVTHSSAIGTRTLVRHGSIHHA